MNDNLTLLAFVLDRSGSMVNIALDMEGGLNTLIKEQAAQPGECRVTLAQFDEEYELIADYVDAKLLTEPFHLVPRGWTALHDAVGKTITVVGERLASIPEAERPGKVIVTIITDGGENSSHEWTREAVVALTKRQTDVYGWQFNYLGANQDAIAVGASMGIHNSMTYGASDVGVANTYLAASASITRSRGGQSATYTEEEQTAAMGNPASS